MQFNFPEGRKPEATPEMEVGNVYISKNTHKTKAWLVMAISGRTVHLLGLDADGQISGTQSYNSFAIENRPLIGRVDMSALEFDIEAIDQ